VAQATFAPSLWVVGLSGRAARRWREGPALPTDRRAADHKGGDAVATPIGRVKPRQSDAFSERFENYRPDVMRLCTRLLGRDDAEDATHEVFLRAQTRIETFDATQPFRRWLLAIGSNHCIDRLRRRATERLLFTTDDPNPLKSPVMPSTQSCTQPSALEGVIRSQNREALLAALDQLPDRYRAPLVLRYFAELDYDTIADELELTRAQVGTLLFRAKRCLRAWLPTENR